MKARVFLRANDNYVEVEGLKDAANPSADLSTATVVAEMFDASGNAITGSDITLSFVAGTTYTFRGTLPSTISVNRGDRGTLHIDVSGAGIPVGHWEIDYEVKERTS